MQAVFFFFLHKGSSLAGGNGISSKAGEREQGGKQRGNSTLALLPCSFILPC